jgi:glycosyltransferase involved in cell wall biosynthesis
MAVRVPWELPVNPLAPAEVRRRLATGGFDVAHVHMGVVSPFATDMTRVALGLGLPTAVTWHCLMERSRPLFRALGHARRWGLRGAALSAVSGVAAASVAGVLGRGPDTPSVAVLPNGIDPGLWRPPPGRPEPAADRPVHVVAAMRLATRKRPVAVLEVAAQARELAPPEVPMRLEVFGEGPERGRLERFVERHGMGDWVSLPGRVQRDELRQRYWDADLYLTPARLEAFGIAALEARTAGLPVLARSGTGVGDFVVDGVNGVLGADDAALGAALARLVTDASLRRRIAHENASVAPPQTWTAVVALAEAEYRRAGAG